MLLSAIVLKADDSASRKVGWKWLIQYSYTGQKEAEMADRILIQMYDDGRIRYIRPGLIGGGAAWSREVKKTPEEIEKIKQMIEEVLKKSSTIEYADTDSNKLLDAHITIRTAEELVEAWGDDRFRGDPSEQVKKVFRNLRQLNEDTHNQIQKVMEHINAEANKLKWEYK